MTRPTRDDPAEAFPVAGSPQQGDSSDSLHELFNMQVRELLESNEFDEEQKQEILVSLACPCCGGGAASVRFKIGKRLETKR